VEPPCRYANSAMFLNEMEGLTLSGAGGEPVSGEQLMDSSTAAQLDNDLSVGTNIAILCGMLAVVRVSAYLGLKLAYRYNWL
jgi:hypothetical protein